MKISQSTLLCTALFSLLTAIQVSADYGRGNSVADSLDTGRGAVIAKVIERESELIGGPKAKGRVGDFILANSRAGFIISGTRPSTGWWTPLGGVVEDAGYIRDGYWWNLAGEAPFVLFKGSDPMFSGRLIAPVKAELLEDGSSGEAIVRIYGRDTQFPIRDETMGNNSVALKVRVMIDYILRPDTSALEMKLTLLNGSSHSKTIGLGQVMVLGDGADPYIPGRGFNYSKIAGVETPFFGGEGANVSYGWFPEEGDVTVHIQISKPFITKLCKIRVPPKGQASASAFLVVGGGGMNPIYEQYYKLKGIDNAGTIKGRITNAYGLDRGNVSVNLMDPDGSVLNRAYPDGNGNFSLIAEPGKYLLQAWSFDRETPSPKKVVLGAGETVNTELDISEPAVLEFDVTDGRGMEIPSVINFDTLSDNRGDDRFFKNRNTKFFKNYFTAKGKGEVEIKPGIYDVYISHGLQYEYKKFTLKFSAGDRQRVSAVLEKAVDSTGYLTSDFHMHSVPSFDSFDTQAEKVTAAYAVGLDVPVATDHNMRTDYKPAIRQLGLDKLMNSVTGNEITTMRLGHYNAFPLEYKPQARNLGAVEYYERAIPDVFAEVREDTPWPVVVQLNHPRVMGGGYLDFVGYDPVTGTFSDNKNGTFDFDALEILNGDMYSEMEETLIDWYSFINRGKKVAGAGNSDSHRVFNIQLGCPMNYVRSSTDVPGEMAQEEFIRSILGQHMTVSNGPLVTADVNGAAGMGDLITDTDGMIELNVDVQAPTWVDFNTIRVIANGEEIISAGAGRRDNATRVRKTFRLNPESDTWYVVRVDGDKKMFPVFPGKKPVAFTNPVYVDVNGNGRFDFPGLPE